MAAARKERRRRDADRPDPEHLLGLRFTFRELRDIPQAIAGKTLQKDTFRRALEPHQIGSAPV